MLEKLNPSRIGGADLTTGTISSRKTAFTA